jgi:hypothetical protein
LRNDAQNAAFFALIGMVLITLIGTGNLIINVTGAVRGFIPALAAATAILQFLGDLSLLIFFVVYYKAQ